jgi:hypothetical protein
LFRLLLRTVATSGEPHLLGGLGYEIVRQSHWQCDNRCGDRKT